MVPGVADVGVAVGSTGAVCVVHAIPSHHRRVLGSWESGYQPAGTVTSSMAARYRPRGNGEDHGRLSAAPGLHSLNIFATSDNDPPSMASTIVPGDDF